MIHIVLKVLLVMLVYGIIFYFIIKKRKLNFFSSNRNDKDNNNNDDGGEMKPDDFPTLDLPPGVYILPPGAPDPSLRKPNEKVRR